MSEFINLVAMSSALNGTDAVNFLFWMLCVIAFGIWLGMREDK
jgi:hypothetical protein